MSNWVTLPNGVHIDLDDPNNPLTGDGSFESYLGGGDKGSSKGSGKDGTVVKNYGMSVAVNFGGRSYPIGDEPDTKDMASVKNEFGLEKLGTIRAEDGKTYEIYGSGFGNLGHTKEVAVEIDTPNGFTPTKQTIWNDKSHPLYGIAPSEQNEDYLKSAIAEMSKYSDRWSTMSKNEKNEISPNGKVALDKRIKQYSKALEYIKSFK